MTEQPPPSPPGGGRRRSSITEMFMPRPNMGGSQQSQSSSPPNSNAQPPRRAMSITTLGLSGTSGPNTPYSAFARQRRASGTSSASGSPEFRNSFEDNAVIEEDGTGGTDAPAPTPTSPSFSRRVSFGAQALRDARGGTAQGGRHSFLSSQSQKEKENQDKASTLSSSAQAGNASRGEGFNWGEALRDRTRRQPSVTSGNSPFQPRQRAASLATVEPPKEIPKPQSPAAPKSSKPDHLGERMLRGDFMMD